MRSTLLAALVAVSAAGCAGSGSTGATPASTTTTVAPRAEVPYQSVAEDSACAADAAVLRSAEDNAHVLDGAFATMDELVSNGYLRAPSTYFVDVQVGTPPGGYTLVGGKRCGNRPVVP